MKSGSFTREVLAAWLVASVAVAIGLFLLALHDPETDVRMWPRAYEPPAAAVEQSDEGVFVRSGTSWGPPQSGSSTAPDTPPEHQ
jgi:hypothetical protein